jgi:hypothetical protein
MSEMPVFGLCEFVRCELPMIVDGLENALFWEEMNRKNRNYDMAIKARDESINIKTNILTPFMIKKYNVCPNCPLR